jgi:hypothetical protein
MPQHVVVDGSNIATEGRSLPSLAQLNEAVMAFMAENPDALITVVVDATFGHRIDQKEAAEFDEAVSNNELVAPPAGAVGRGDAFVLSIANKVGATILTNDSFQEFHGQYDWLFDEGRLIGGKPVPHIGWVFVPRIPVRGAVSRSAVKEAKRKRGGATGGAKATATVRQGSAAANQPMPVPKAPPPGPRQPAAAKAEAAAATEVVAAASATPKATAVNDFLPFLSFVEHHPVGSSVNAIVENYSSHGAYVRVGDVKGYVPLRLMADPAPRSAREFMKIGDAVTLVVESFAPARRSIDLAVAGMATAKLVEAPPVKVSKARKRPAKSADTPPESPAAPVPDAPDAPVEQTAVDPSPAAAKPSRRRKAAAPSPATAPVAVEPVAEPAPVAPAPAKKSARSAKKAAVPTVATVTPAPAKKSARGAKKAAAPVEPAALEPAAAPAKKAATPAKKAAAPAKKTAKRGAGRASGDAVDETVSDAARARRRRRPS